MAQPFNTSLKNVAGIYAELLAVKVTATSVKRDLEGNPFYPSLLSLSDTFTRYRIDNDAFRVSPEKLFELQPPFVAFVNIPAVGKDFVLVTKMTNDTVTYSYKSKRGKTVSREEFVARYENIVWVAEPGENSGEAEFAVKRRVEKARRNATIAWACAGTVLLLLAIGANVAAVSSVATYLALVGIKLVGLSAAVLLLVYEIDKNNRLVKDICGAGAQTNCDAVLGSKASKIMGISWGEIGFFYFGATSLLLLFPAVPFAEKTGWIALANAVAVPYIFFSVYYQWRVVRQWCPLCLAVQAVLLSELVWSIVNWWAARNPLTLPAVSLIPAICVLAPVVAWYGIKPVLRRAGEAGEHAAAFRRLQYNPEIFQSILLQQEKAPEGWEDLGIGIGNPNAKNTIIKVCNPYCGPCARAHPVLEEIVERNEEVQLRVIFTSKDDKTDRRATVVKHLLSIAAEGDRAKTQRALDDWYLAGQKDYSGFAGKYVPGDDLDEQGKQLDAMRAWCDEAEILHTPTIFVNGYRLPANYELQELKNIL